MSLIFDSFPSRDLAERFVAVIKDEFGLAGLVFDDEESAFMHDMFPYRLEAPIVHIDLRAAMGWRRRGRVLWVAV
jgi:hypothetical protein